MRTPSPAPPPHRSRSAALALLLAAAPFVPRGGDDDGSLLPSGDETGALAAADTAGAGHGHARRCRPRSTGSWPQGRTVGRRLRRRRPRPRSPPTWSAARTSRASATASAPGWTDDTQARCRPALPRPRAPSPPGVPPRDHRRPRRARPRCAAAPPLSPAARAAAERAELTAGRPLGRQGVAAAPRDPGRRRCRPASWTATPRPAHGGRPASAPPHRPRPDARTDAQPPRPTPSRRMRGLPAQGTVLDPTQVAEQKRTYWCGPTTMQMIAWGWTGHRAQPGATGPTGSAPPPTAPAITDMVRVVNDDTGWDRADHAGTYIVARHRRLLLRAVAAAADAPHRRLPGAARAAPDPAQEVLPLPRRRRLRALPGRPGLRQGTATGRPRSATSSRGTSSASTPPSRTSPGCSGATPTRATAPTRPTSSTTSASDAPPTTAAPVRRRRGAAASRSASAGCAATSADATDRAAADRARLAVRAPPPRPPRAAGTGADGQPAPAGSPATPRPLRPTATCSTGRPSRARSTTRSPAAALRPLSVDEAGTRARLEAEGRLGDGHRRPRASRSPTRCSTATGPSWSSRTGRSSTRRRRRWSTCAPARRSRSTAPPRSPPSTAAPGRWAPATCCTRPPTGAPTAWRRWTSRRAPRERGWCAPAAAGLQRRPDHPRRGHAADLRRRPPGRLPHRWSGSTAPTSTPIPGVTDVQGLGEPGHRRRRGLVGDPDEHNDRRVARLRPQRRQLTSTSARRRPAP